MPVTSTKDEDFIAAIEAAVAEYGEDYVYPESQKRAFKKGDTPMCQYFDLEDPGKPLCLIGVALSKLGATFEDIREIKPVIDYGHGGLTSSAFRVMEKFGFGPYVSEAARWAQVTQDRGETWGEALRAFRQKME